jgi:hypothetical protein
MLKTYQFLHSLASSNLCLQYLIPSFLEVGERTLGDIDISICSIFLHCSSLLHSTYCTILPCAATLSSFEVIDLGPFGADQFSNLI